MRTALVWTIALAALSACGDKTTAELGEKDGGALVVQLDGGHVSLRFGGAARLELPPDGLQLGTVPAYDDALSYDPYWLEYKDAFFSPAPPKSLRWRTPTRVQVLSAKPTEITLRYDAEGASTAVTFNAVAPGRFVAKAQPTTTEDVVAYVRLKLRADRQEAFYGLGEVFDTVNHRGQLRPMQMEASLELESNNTETHVPVPLLIGSRGWGVFVASDRAGLFDVARKQDDLVEITYGLGRGAADGLAFELYAEAKPLDVTRHYYASTGQLSLPAPWALGPWVWRNETRDQTQLLDDLQQLRQRDLATTGLWIDRPYASAVNSFDFDPQKFPDAGVIAGAIAANGLAFALWHTPYLEANAPLRADANRLSYFPPKIGSQLNSWGPILDFTRPEVSGWWRQALAAYVGLGVRGYKLDFAEDIALGVSGNRIEWRFADGSDERTEAFAYPLRYHRTYAGLYPSGTFFLLTRTGRPGSQTYGPVIWPGDIDATLTKWKEPIVEGGRTSTGVGGLPAAVVAGLSLGPSGFPFFASDTGGYRHSPPNKETWVRWVEHSALMPAMQTGDSSSQMPWEFLPANGRDDEALEVYRQFARLHLRLFPFFWSLANATVVDGRAIARPLGLQFPELGAHPDDEYTLGDDLLVAPVVRAGATSRELVVPPGRWRDWFTGAALEGTVGAKVTVPAPLTKLPLFVREGALVPLLRPTIDTLMTASNTAVDAFGNDVGTLFVRVVPGADGRFTLYDGTVLEQQAGKVHVVPGTIFVKGVTLEVMATAKPAQVTVNGAARGEGAGWSWSADVGGTLTVPAGTGELTVGW